MPDKVTTDRGAVDAEVIDAEFADAFNVAAEVGERAELIPADDPANVSNEPPVVIPPVVEIPAPVVDAPVIETPDPAIQQPGESDEKYEQRYKTLQGIHKHDMDNWKEERLTLLAQIEEARKTVPAPEKKPETAIPADLEDSLSEEDKEALSQYEVDFDVVSKMEGKKRDREMKKLRVEFEGFIQNIKDELKTEFVTQLAPATALVAETQAEREIKSELDHFAAIRVGHGDFETYRDNGSITKWIETKPAYLRKSMIETYERGAADDIVDLISDFKTENNIPITQPSPDATNVVDINARKEAKEAKKLAMTAVPTRRGAVNASMSVASDFEGAFDEAINKGG